jgi:ABC-type multidrug transport system fused ATPase/permease subunit
VMQLREIFRRFWSYARPYRRWLPLIVVFAVLGAAIQAATIWIFCRQGAADVKHDPATRRVPRGPPR